jgi:AcrR family transcriptional regulator
VPGENGGTDRRVRRTRKALEDAFVALVLERGYDKVTVDDIANRADVARPTFYAHYADKEDLLTAVFNWLLEDLGSHLAYADGPWTTTRTAVVEALYRHAAQYRDLYRVCLGGAGNGRAREAYVDLLSDAAARNYSDRITALGTMPRVPVLVMARATAGAHVAVLRSWLEGQIDLPIEELVPLVLDFVVAGAAWAHGLSVDEVELASRPEQAPPPDPGHDRGRGGGS